MAIFFDQFVAFGTDLIGLERILRGVQSVVQILAAWPLLLTYVTFTISTEKLSLLPVAFNLLQSRIGLARRIIRTFLFLDTFNAGWLVYQRHAADRGSEVWMDVMSKTTLGMYGMLETITLLDVMDVPGLEVFGPQKTREYNRQAMIFWFLALLFSALGCLVRISKSSKAAAVSSEQEKEGAAKGDKSISEKAKLDALVKKAAHSAAVHQLGVKFATNALDMIIPAATVGWIDVEPETVASVMLLTTYLTGKDSWDRCGAAVDARAA